jgi:hypothetical protein
MTIGCDVVLGRSMGQRCIACVDVLLINEIQNFAIALFKGPTSSFMRRVPPEMRKKAPFQFLFFGKMKKISLTTHNPSS